MLTPGSPSFLEEWTPNHCFDCGWECPAKTLWPSQGKIAVRWIEDKLIFPEGDTFGEPFRCRADQKLFLYRWYEYCPQCQHWRFDEGIKGAATGDGKTTFIAAIALLEFAGPKQIAPKSPVICIAAAAWDQAAELFRKAGQMVGGRDNEFKMAPLCGIFNVFNDRIEFKDGRPGLLERVAAVAGTNEGGIPTLFIADELHEWGEVGSNKARVFTVIGKSQKKRGKKNLRGAGRSLALSTAGFDKDNSLLGDLCKTGEKALLNPRSSPKMLYDWREAPEGLNYEDPEHRRIAIRAASEAADVLWNVEDRVWDWGKAQFPPHEWIRYYANRWVDVAVESWLKDHPFAWRNCMGHWESDPSNPFVISVDMALKHDSVAVNRCEILPDGRVAVTTKVWNADSEGLIDHEEVWLYIKRKARGKDFRGVVYDPRFFEVQARILEKHGILAIQFDQTPERMSPACGMTRQYIIATKIVHNGDLDLDAAVRAAVAMPLERGGFVLRKSKSKRKIDPCIAMCMGVFVLFMEDERKPPPAAPRQNPFRGGDRGLWRPTGRLGI